MSSQSRLQSKTQIDMGYPALGRLLHAPRMIIFLGGINLILIQWVLVRELTALLLGTELVVLLVSVAYFSGLSLGYFVSKWVKDSWFIPLAIITLFLHLSLPIWFRLLVVVLDQSSAYWASFLILPILTPFVVSAFYSILLPALVDGDGDDLPTMYMLEVLGSALGIFALVILGGYGMSAVFALYAINLCIMLALFRARLSLVGFIALVSMAWMMIFPSMNNWSNALWYQQLRNLPTGTITLFTAYSPYQKVDVLQDPNGDRYLYLDGLLHFGTNRWSRLNVMMGSVPADLLHPQNSLVVGAGSMHMERLIADYGAMVTTVELDPVVVAASIDFFADMNLMNILDNRAVVIDDAKHFIANTDQKFDLIATDVPVAFLIQTATLYSVEFYEQIASHLNENGVLVVNLTMRFKEDNIVSRRIAASLLSIFDDVVIITSESSKLSYAFAGEHLPFDLLQLQDTLEAFGETDYVLYLPTAIEQIVGDAQPITLDSMDLVLQISADWLADRLRWR